MKCKRCGKEQSAIIREICYDCQSELQQEEEEYHGRLNDMYTMDENGFCDGFTKY